jgi:small subunit ribosomal protein S20
MELYRMANHASAIKAHRQSLKRRLKNKSNRSSLKTVLKRFSEELEAGHIEEAKSAVNSLYSLVDRGIQKKVISKNAAARRKSRLTQRLNTALTGTSKE